MPCDLLRKRAPQHDHEGEPSAKTPRVGDDRGALAEAAIATMAAGSPESLTLIEWCTVSLVSHCCRAAAKNEIIWTRGPVNIICRNGRWVSDDMPAFGKGIVTKVVFLFREPESGAPPTEVLTLERATTVTLDVKSREMRSVVATCHVPSLRDLTIIDHSERRDATLGVETAYFLPEFERTPLRVMSYVDRTCRL